MMAALAVTERRTTTRNGIIVEIERVPITVDQCTDPLWWSYRLWVELPDGTRIAAIDQREKDIFALNGRVANLIHDSLVTVIERIGWSQQGLILRGKDDEGSTS